MSTIETILASTHEDLLLHIFDNASSDATRETVNAIEDERVRYRRSEKVLSISDSFERAFGFAETDWITGLGSDDGYTRTAIAEMLGLAREADLRAVATEHASFHWPGVTTAEHGRLRIRHIVEDEVKSSDAVIREILRGRAKYQALPTAYKSGLVHRSVLEAIRTRHTRVFDSWTPDVFLGFAVARSTDYFVKTGKPLAISGTSKGSTGWSTLGGGPNPEAGDEYFALSRQAAVPLDPGIASVDGSLPKHMVIMTLEAYLRATPRPSLWERFLSSPLMQLGILIGGRRPVSPEVLDWARTYSRTEPGRLSGWARWAVARVLGWRHRSAARIRRVVAARGLAPGVRLTVDDAEQVIRLARLCRSVTVLPGPETVAGAARILDAGLQTDMLDRQRL